MSQPLMLTAPVAFEAGGAALPKKLRGTAYSGGRVPDRNLVIDLATTSITTPAPLLAGHLSGSVVGRITQASVAGAISIEGDLYSDIDDDARAIAQKAARGHPWQLSVGLYGHTWEDVPPGKTVSVNGQSFDGPITVLRNGVVREVSIVALGADPAADAAFFTQQRGRSMSDQNAAVAQLATLTVERDQARANVTRLEAENRTQAARITELEGQLATLTERARAAETAQRTTDVRAMLQELGLEFSEAAAAPYLAMSAEVFAGVRTQLSQLKPKLPAHLAHSVADLGAGGGSGQQPAPGGLLLQTVKAQFGIK